MNGGDILIPIIALIAIAAVLISLITTKNRERMAMIEKGLSSDVIKAMHTKDLSRDPLGSLKWGIIFILAGAAIMVGNYLREHYLIDDGVVVGLVCLFVGLGLVIFYSIASKRSDK